MKTLILSLTACGEVLSTVRWSCLHVNLNVSREASSHIDTMCSTISSGRLVRPISAMYVVSLRFGIKHEDSSWFET